RKSTLYALVDPISPPPQAAASQRPRVEAPGTAPGSDRFIAVFVYRHSRRERRQSVIYAFSGASERGAMKAKRAERSIFPLTFPRAAADAKAPADRSAGAGRAARREEGRGQFCLVVRPPSA